jgi:copper resistance protein C
MTARRAILVGALALAAAGSAPAHSLLLESSPGAGSVLAGSPRELSLRFNNRIEKKLSTIHLRDEHGAVRTAAVRVADGPADWLTATVDALPAGAWRVEWRVLSTDGHVVSGSFSFRVAP